jgi:pimeloyl-ACP methyl ester carboxylesterase
VAPDRRTGFVLVHGSELGAWVWERLLDELDRPAVAVDLPGRGDRPARGRDVDVEDAVAAVVDGVDRCDADAVVLVAHSFAGVLVPSVVARRRPRVAAVVFVTAAVPREGAAWVDLQAPPQRALLRVLYRVRPDGIRSPDKANRSELCHDLDEATTEAVLRRRVAEPPGPLLQPVPAARLPDGLPVHYVRTARDRSLAPERQDTMIARLRDPRVHELHTGHLPMLADAPALAAVLERAAEASSTTGR